MTKTRSTRHKRIGVLSEKPKLEHGQKVARIVQSCGENIYEIEDEYAQNELYQLPKRLRHVAFIRRGSFVFVRRDNSRRAGKICGEIETVVLDRFLASLQKDNFWPKSFLVMNGDDGAASSAAASNDVVSEEKYNLSEGQDGTDDDDWDIGEGNPNRTKWDHISSGESSEDE